MVEIVTLLIGFGIIIIIILKIIATIGIALDDISKTKETVERIEKKIDWTENQIEQIKKTH